MLLFRGDFFHVTNPSYFLNTGYSLADSSTYNPRIESKNDAEHKRDPVVEVLTPYGYENFSSGDSRSRTSGKWSRTLRLKITGKDGLEKLDVRVPVSFLSLHDGKLKHRLVQFLFYQKFRTMLVT